MRGERKTYTARDLSRNPARVFEDARTYGDAEIRTRDGETFVLTLRECEKPDLDLEKIRADFEGLRAMQAKENPKPLSEADLERINQIIAGEI